MRTMRTMWSKYWLLADVDEVRSGLAECEWVRATLYTTLDEYFVAVAECGRGSGTSAQVMLDSRQRHKEITAGLECIRALFAEVSPCLERSVPSAEQLLFPFAIALVANEPQGVGDMANEEPIASRARHANI